MSDTNCCYCNEPIDVVWVGAGEDGRAHRHCYYAAHPYQPKKTFAQVLAGAEDRQILNWLLMEYVNEDAQAIIVRRFHDAMVEKWKRLMEP